MSKRKVDKRREEEKASRGALFRTIITAVLIATLGMWFLFGKSGKSAGEKPQVQPVQHAPQINNRKTDDSESGK